MNHPATSRPQPDPEHGAVRVLLVDDDEEDFLLTRDVAREIASPRIEMDWEPDFDLALEAICLGRHDVYLIDYRLGRKSGLELLTEVKARKCKGPVILLTGQGEPEIDRAALAAGAADYLEKSRLDPVVLERMIRYAIRQHAQEADLERKVVERTAELEAANRELRESDRRKDEFLATLAHELRNPLAPIRNALELMKLASDDLNVAEKARAVMDRQVSHLVRLIDDLLDASRLNRSKLSLNCEPLDLREVIDIAVETSQPQIDKAGLTLARTIPDGVMPLVGDRVRLTQIFANILNNAAKYTDRGGSVLLGVEKQPSEFHVRISDNGMGIPPEHLNRVFDLFTQVDRSLHRQNAGLGIGLALVRRLVDMHGGSVTAESPGLQQGTTITVILPRPAPTGSGTEM